MEWGRSDSPPMPFLLLLLLSIVVVVDRWWPPFWSDGSETGSLLPALLTTATVIGVIAAAAGMAAWTRRAVRRNPENHSSIRHRYRALRQIHLLLMVASYGLILFGFGWGWLVEQLCNQSAALAGIDLFVLVPFLVMVVGSWACFYDGEKALRESRLETVGTYWTRWGYVDFQLRQNLALVAAPVGLMMVLKFLHRVIPDQTLVVSLSILFTVSVFIGQPWILRFILRLKPLPQGPLRNRLLSTSERLGFRCSNILLWNTNSGVVNAMVAGLIPYPRYVMMTDRLVAELSPEEVEAVFGHEVGHIKHGHIPYYAAFLLGSMVAAIWIASLTIDSIPALRAAAEGSPWVVAIAMQVFLLGSVFLVFGFLSRRCERQADVFGCRAVSCAQSNCPEHSATTELPRGGRGLCRTGIGTFIEALEKVALLNGICRSRPGWSQSWRHSTIARRVDFLRELRDDPQAEAQFQRTVGRVKWGLVWGLVAVFIGLAALQWGSDFVAVLAHLKNA